MKNQIKHVSGFVDQQMCKALSDHAEKNTYRFIDYGNREKEFMVYRGFEIEQADPSINKIISIFGHMVYQYISKEYAPSIFSKVDENQNQIARFTEGYGMHEHFDASRPQDYATLIYLNDNYDGGELYFPDYGIEIKPKSGDLICFPDNPDFVHGVKPILNGIRYTSPRWFTRIV